MTTRKLTAAEIKAVEAQIKTLEGFSSDYADEMLTLYKELLNKYA